MKIEHDACNVADVASWYRPRLGLAVACHTPSPTNTHFLHDGAATS